MTTHGQPTRMRDAGPRRRFRSMAAFVALQWAAAVPAPAATAATPTPCDSSGARLELQLAARPPEAAVGDVVELAVTVTNPGGGLAGLRQYKLNGAAPVFAAVRVDDGSAASGVVRYRLTALQAGRATLQAFVSYETSHDCFGYPTYFYRSSQSDPLVVAVRDPDGAADTPTPTVTPTPMPACGGDCDGDGRVDVAELVRAVAIALGAAPVSACAAADADASGAVAVDEIVAAVGAALDGCPPLRPAGR